MTALRLGKLREDGSGSGMKYESKVNGSGLTVYCEGQES